MLETQTLGPAADLLSPQLRNGASVVWQALQGTPENSDPGCPLLADVPTVYMGWVLANPTPQPDLAEPDYKRLPLQHVLEEKCPGLPTCHSPDSLQ